MEPESDHHVLGKWIHIPSLGFQNDIISSAAPAMRADLSVPTSHLLWPCGKSVPQSREPSGGRLSRVEKHSAMGSCGEGEEGRGGPQSRSSEVKIRMKALKGKESRYLL